MSDERLAELATELGLPVSVLDVLDIGWWADRRWWNPKTSTFEGPPGCWTFPEYDSLERVTGLGLRWPNGNKGQATGGRRGLTLPKGWRDFSDPIIVAEGPSDVMAGRMLGLNVIGRPSNTGGAELIAQACRDRRVVILGENDRKPNGIWPGQIGAKALATKLQSEWERPVPIAFPPVDAKDVRAWFIYRYADLPSELDDNALAALGREFLSLIQPPAILLLAGPRSRRSSRVVVKGFQWDAAIGIGPIHVDKIDLDDTRARKRFANAIAQLKPGVDAADLQERLMNLEIPQPAKRPRVRRALRAQMSSESGETGAKKRIRIQANQQQLRVIRDDAFHALIANNEPPRLFSRTGGVVRVAQTSDEHGQSIALIQQLDADAVRGELSNAADWYVLRRSKEGGETEIDELPPLAIARDILALPHLNLPPLTGIITCPTFSPDGGLITGQGYDVASGLWHHRTLTDLPPVPDEPSGDDIESARKLLLDILADFPFIDQASRAHAFALFLLPFVRSLISGPTPCHGVDAPTAGTGKDLLVKAATYPALGYDVGATTTAKDPDEWRKKITSLLIGGCPVVLWGNVAYRLDSEHLAAVLTDVSWRDRLLGQSREVTLPNRAIWVATGNNLSFTKELARRIVWIRLDAKVEAPESRKGFRHANLIQYVRDHRTRLVHAALTLVQAWLAAGRPAGTQVMGSFESYTAVMGGILDVVGVRGFLTNADELRQRGDTETSEWRAFILSWWRRWNDAWLGVSDLAALLWDENRERTDLLINVITSGKERGALTQLGRRLSNKRDAIIAGYQITAGEQKDRCGRLMYRLVQLTLQTSASKTESLQEICIEVCTRNPHEGNGLEGGADLRIPNSNPPTHTRESEHPHVHRGVLNAPVYKKEDREKSAKVCTSAQHPKPQQVMRADLPAGFVQTPFDRFPMSADPDSTPIIRWFTGNGGAVSQTVIELARERDGWTPIAWRDRMLQLADACAGNNPDRADELRQAAALMSSDEERAP
ncbi:MAG TPA: hypothetical protein PKN33_16950 [Phycisphaerae bacterium]|nr:hypothetical protein [Phycisphaerae bacterium]